MLFYRRNVMEIHDDIKVIGQQVNLWLWSLFTSSLQTSYSIYENYLFGKLYLFKSLYIVVVIILICEMSTDYEIIHFILYLLINMFLNDE